MCSNPFNFYQTSGRSFKTKMIKLGSNNQATLEAQVNAGIKFSDMFAALPYDKASGKCPGATSAYKLINAGFGPECLMVKVSFLNTACFCESDNLILNTPSNG